MLAGPFNFVTFVSVLIPGYSLVTREHGLGYISKLRSMPSFVDGWIDGLRDGARAGRVATARGVAAAVDAIDALLRRDVTDDPLASQEPPSELNPADAAAWRADVVAASNGPMAYYTGPSPDVNRPGTYYVNATNPAAWSRYQLEATTFHEAVPGHHLQLVLAQEADLHPVVGVKSTGDGRGRRPAAHRVRRALRTRSSRRSPTVPKQLGSRASARCMRCNLGRS